MMIEIEPTPEQVHKWINHIIPERDLFFIEEKDLKTFAENLNEVLVIPREEFFNHTSYNQVQLVNSYIYWNISRNAKYILVAPPNWITNLTDLKRNELLGIQVKMRRGLIFPSSLFASRNAITKEYTVLDKEEEYVVIQNDMWKKLPYTMKEHAIKEYALLWENWSCYEVPEKTPIHIKRYANKFSIEAGSNCLSATLFAITQNEWMVSEWVHPETFLHGLKQANYSLTDDQISNGDVVAWVDTDGVIQHASYHIGNQLYFNKNGQTFFNPWKVIHWDQLNTEWNQYKVRVYRLNYN